MRERMTAVRASVADIIKGKYGDDNGPRVISPFGVELRRVVLVGYIRNQYMGQGNFASITIDDGSETIRGKLWGTEASSLETVKLNSFVMVVGKVREYQDEIYIAPEIVRELDDPNYMTTHMLERYRAMLTLSGVTYPDSASLETDDFGSEQSSLEESTSTSSTPKKSSVTGLSKQILQFIEQHANPEGVSIQDIVSFFEVGGHEKSAVQLKVLDLIESERIVEIEIGKYLPA